MDNSNIESMFNEYIKNDTANIIKYREHILGIILQPDKCDTQSKNGEHCPLTPQYTIKKDDTNLKLCHKCLLTYAKMQNGPIDTNDFLSSSLRGYDQKKSIETITNIINEIAQYGSAAVKITAEFINSKPIFTFHQIKQSELYKEKGVS